MSHLKQYTQYIKNTGQVPLKIEHFDDDWAPIGLTVRIALRDNGLVTEEADGLRLTRKGESL